MSPIRPTWTIRAALGVALLASPAHADCPVGQTPASCTLHEEAVELFTSGKYEQAAIKFRAAIAAGATARSYLGYSQSVEGQGKIALAYETMLVAQRLSKEEMATRGTDPEIIGRSERIKYKLGELGAKVAYVWLRLPAGIPPQRVVSVFRAGEGDLPAPIGRWIIVAPDRQVLYASLDDGSRIELVATIAPGAQGTLVIPIAAPAPPRPQIRPSPPRPQPPAGRPIQQLYKKKPAKPVPNPANVVFALDGTMLLPNVGNVSAGVGFGGLYERKLARRLAATVRAGIVFHPEETYDELGAATFSAREGVFLAGVRTRSKLPVYAGFEAGALVYSQTATHLAPGEFTPTEEDYSHVYPALALGGGVRLGKAHLEMGLVYAINAGADVDMGLRFMTTLGVDLVKR